VKVCTYNIRLGIQKGVMACADVLRPWAPDLVALQEVGRHWTMGPTGRTAAEIAQSLGLAHHVHVPALITANDERYGTALLSRWPIDVREVIELPQAVDEPRRLLIAGIRPSESAGAASVTVMSTHLSHLVQERPAQGDLLAQRAHGEAQLAPTVVLGDLNDPGPTQWLDHLREDFVDAAPGPHAPATFPTDAPKRRIDYLLLSRGAGRWRSAHVPCDPATAAASDHFPVIATLDLDLVES
jgi:endonuclease/exonuclease/phosphatase family metal-dependent hydrolase